MKIIQFLVLLCVTFNLVATKAQGKNNNLEKHHTSHKKLKVQKTKCKGTKCPGGRAAPQQAWKNLAFPDIKNDAYVNSDPYILQNTAGFKNAKLWTGTLPTNLNYFPYTGDFKTADTGVHNKFYYDGSLHLGKVAQVNCDMYTTEPRSCVNEKGCGWCGASNKCIGASPLGPITPCVRSTFIYTLPSAEWNPLKAPAINILAQDSNGNSLLNLTPEPNLRDAPVAKPYRLD